MVDIDENDFVFNNHPTIEDIKSVEKNKQLLICRLNGKTLNDRMLTYSNIIRYLNTSSENIYFDFQHQSDGRIELSQNEYEKKIKQKFLKLKPLKKEINNEY